MQDQVHISDPPKCRLQTAEMKTKRWIWLTGRFILRGMWIRFCMIECYSWIARDDWLIFSYKLLRRGRGLCNFVKAGWTRWLRRDVDQVLPHALVAARVTRLILPMLTSWPTTDHSLLITDHSYSRVTALPEEKRCSSYFADKHWAQFCFVEPCIITAGKTSHDLWLALSDIVWLRLHNPNIAWLTEYV